MASISNFILLALVFFFAWPASIAATHHEDNSTSSYHVFPECFLNYTNSINTSHLLYASNTSSFFTVFRSSIQNIRFLLSPDTTKPIFIITPTHHSQAQAAVACGHRLGLRVRVRSGGHDYEGMSYVSDGEPFFILDLVNFQSVDVNIADSTAWVGAGATLGEVYYNIAVKSPSAGFPAGICPTVGVGGHFSGGGFGTMLRKYGTAADNVVDAIIVDVNGNIMDKQSMGEDLFWAIRGGGGASFGVILAYKIKLVPVTPTVTVFRINKTLKQGATRLVEKWQYVAPNFDDNLFIRIVASAINDTESVGNRTVQTVFECLFLGERAELISILDESFPELGVTTNDCSEMSWIESVLFFAGYSNESSTILLDRMPQFNSSFKAKSDFVREPILEAGWESIWTFLMRSGVEEPLEMIMDPWKGRMDEIAEDTIPFPHRRGNLYNIQYFMRWFETEEAVTQRHLRWMRELYAFMGPYVSKNPRAAYLNYKDIDLGRNETPEKTSYVKAKVWGNAYFLDNFERLAKVKAQVDPNNYFWNEQSIPPYSAY
ncbi:berberine bridge enzyme-like 22 [Canna indica]|uniref:Berberine bridge enzyme-like 22 n=1 Tax=Canna indica TaxID=4628 RepID=A0AAQ3Q6L3_9LILI|nr:berberine bridge enzyme-like 22 [Canna indica]